MSPMPDSARVLILASRTSQADVAQGITAAAFADAGAADFSAPEVAVGVGVHYGPLKCELVKHRGERKIQFGMVGM